MMKEDEGDGDYTRRFLSPSKSPKKRVTGFGRKEDSPRDRRRSMISPGQLKKRLSLFPRNKKAGTDEGDDDDSEEKGRADLSALLSPRLEQEIQKRDRERRKTNAFSSPLNTLKASTNILRSSFHGILPFREKKTDEDSSSFSGSSDESEDTEYEEYEVEVEVEVSDDDDSGDSEDEIENVATEDDMMLLLCRELELMDGDEEDGDYDEDDE